MPAKPTEHAGEASQQEHSPNMQQSEDKELTKSGENTNKEQAMNESEVPEKTGDAEESSDLINEGQE